MGIESKSEGLKLKRKKRAKIIVGIIILGIGIGFSIFLLYSYPAMPEADLALESDANVQVTRSEWITFTPVVNASTTGFVFYPGGKVSASAYAPLVRAIAEAGFPSFLVPMPLDLAVFAPDKAAGVLLANPSITTWAIGGHSLGGTMAAQFVHVHPGDFSGIVFLASYPADANNLSSIPIDALSIYGTNDKVLRRDIPGTASLLPGTASIVEIPGGNHAYFGWYGEQIGDGTATITRETQQAMTLDLIVPFLAGL
nr:alpha/beta hydrolase [Candidatus Sigynarchaeota archaeon]